MASSAARWPGSFGAGLQQQSARYDGGRERPARPRDGRLLVVHIVVDDYFLNVIFASKHIKEIWVGGWGCASVAVRR